MKRLKICYRLFLGVILLFTQPVGAACQEGKLIMFWNLENFFDFRDDGTGDSYTEFSAEGAKRWSKSRFYRKCDAVAKSILWIGSEEGALPDIIGVGEVENAFVLRQLINSTCLKKSDYKVVHYDSPDERGIDCALLYRSSRLKLISSKPCRLDTSILKTRDILLAQFIDSAGDSLAVTVNHHPSKYGGGQTDWKRKMALDRLKELSDSLMVEGWTKHLAIGDFNDGPDNPLLQDLLPSLALCPVSSEKPGLTSFNFGSIRFNGEWELIDLAFASPELNERASFRPVTIPFLTERDAAHSGEKPLRTYSGPRYLGGVSDHLPILVRLTAL